MAVRCPLESLAMTTFGGCYQGRRVVITGHTGFKGSWLALWLRTLGAHVVGVGLPPATSPAHWNLLGLDVRDHLIDIRDDQRLREVLLQEQPEIVFHLAAQSLVRRSYRDPLETWHTNVMGTANLLQACREVSGLKAIVVVSSDKCYENREWDWGYREIDALGGHDPYSASKGATELVAASFRQSFFSSDNAACIASARAGNVIGGGDWSDDRLIPDLVRAISTGDELIIRSPLASRPWQHVLDALSGYLRLGQCLILNGQRFAQAWNFGPDAGGDCTVEQMLRSLKRHWSELRWATSGQPEPRETQRLFLDSAKARAHLAWRTPWSLEESIAATAHWYRVFLRQGQVSSREQLSQYVRAAHEQGCEWAT